MSAIEIGKILQILRSAGGAHKRGLNRALSDASLAEVRRMLACKCAWYGSALLEAGRYYPSSKLCSACGGRKPSLTLAERTTPCSWLRITPALMLLQRPKSSALA